MGIRGTQPSSELRAWRERRKWSLDKMAAVIGVTGVALGRYERGERFPKPQVLHKIHQLTGITANQLLGMKRRTVEVRAASARVAP